MPYGAQWKKIKAELTSLLTFKTKGTLSPPFSMTRVGSEQPSIF